MVDEDKHERIMHAAETLFRARRFHEITLEEVAHTAGVGKGTIYLYFKDKDDLFFKTATRGLDELCELLHSRVLEEGAFRDQIQGACGDISGFFARRRELLRLMQNEEGRVLFARGPLRERWTERRKALLGAVAKILGRGVDQGQVREDVPPEVLAAFLLGLLRARTRDLGDSAPEVRRIELLVDVFLNGAAPRPENGAKCR